VEKQLKRVDGFLQWSRRSKRGIGASVPVYVSVLGVSYLYRQGTKYKTSRARKEAHRCKAPYFVTRTSAIRTHNSFFPLCRLYTTSSRSLIPLPDPNASPNSAAHPSQYPELSRGTVVLALYPDTTAFYRAEVVTTPRDTLVAGLRVRTTLMTPFPLGKFTQTDMVR
jgi:hypothetical protein